MKTDFCQVCCYAIWYVISIIYSVQFNRERLCYYVSIYWHWRLSCKRFNRNLRQESSSRRISLPTLVEYGAVVVKILTQSGQDAILFLTKDSTYEFMHSYGAHQTGMLFKKCAQHLARESWEIKSTRSFKIRSLNFYPFSFLCRLAYLALYCDCLLCYNTYNSFQIELKFFQAFYASKIFIAICFSENCW